MINQRRHGLEKNRKGQKVAIFRQTAANF